MKKFSLILASMLMLISCQQEQFEPTTILRTGGAPSGEDLPTYSFYGSEEEVVSLSERIPFEGDSVLYPYLCVDSVLHSKVLNYIIARDYAFELLVLNISSFFYEPELYMGIISSQDELLHLTARPVVVFDYEDQPYYYEFPILFGDQIIGMMTVSAQPKSDNIIEYVFPYPFTYDASHFGERRYIGCYPTVDYGSSDETFVKRYDYSGEYELISKSELLLDYDDWFMQSIDSLDYSDDIDAESYSSPGPIRSERDLAEFWEWIESQQNTELSERKSMFIDKYPNLEYGSIMNNIPTAIPVIPPFTISPYMWQKIYENLEGVESDFKMYLNSYEDHTLRLLHWAGESGPSIMSWLYRGLYSHYLNKFLPKYDYFVDYDNQYPYWTYGNNFACYDFSAATRSESRERSLQTDNGLYAEFMDGVQNWQSVGSITTDLAQTLLSVTEGKYTIQCTSNPVDWVEQAILPVICLTERRSMHFVGVIGVASKLGGNPPLPCNYGLVMDNGDNISEHWNYPFWMNLSRPRFYWGWKVNN